MGVGTWEDLWILVIGHQKIMKVVWGDRYLRNLKVQGCAYQCKSFTISIMQFCFENFRTRTASNVRGRAPLSKVRCLRRFAPRKILILDTFEFSLLPDELFQSAFLVFL